MQAGDKIQDFILKDTKGNDFTFSNYLNDEKALILFFPLAFSSVCTNEMCYVRDNMKLYNSLNVNVLGISVDSFYTLREFKRVNNIPFPLLSDFNKKVSEQFGVLYQNYFGMNGVSKRAVFVINPEMNIEYTEVVEDSGILPAFKTIQKVLENVG